MHQGSRVVFIEGNQVIGMEGVFVDAGVLNGFEGLRMRIRMSPELEF